MASRREDLVVAGKRGAVNRNFQLWRHLAVTRDANSKVSEGPSSRQWRPSRRLPMAPLLTHREATISRMSAGRMRKVMPPPTWVFIFVHNNAANSARIAPRNRLIFLAATASARPAKLRPPWRHSTIVDTGGTLRSGNSAELISEATVIGTLMLDLRDTLYGSTSIIWSDKGDKALSITRFSVKDRAKGDENR